ncbi:MAG TPA: hypothetical protein VJ904_05630, partial [Tichowtungia sp.]|nr:hypothetical protein [Tichowtungia sp.]
LLHAWNGTEWVGIRVTDYTNGTFFTTRPQHAVIVEEDGRPAPDVLVPDGTWCDSGNRLSSTDTRAMIHLLGRHFDFPYHYWMQFCRRYGFTIEEINPSLLNVFWWHYRGDQVAPAFESRDLERDMDKWSELNITPPEPVEPVLIPEEPELSPAETPAEELLEEMASMPSKEPQKEVEQPAEKTGDDPQTSGEQTVSEIIIEISNPVTADSADPFSTNEIPAAVIVEPAE